MGLCAVLAAFAPVANAVPPTPEPGFAAPLQSGDVQHLKFSYGPIQVLPGQNLILAGPVTIEKPAYDGYLTGFRPDLVRADGSVPPVDIIHLHHGVWLNVSSGGFEQKFAASGEEKTQVKLPPGYGYPVKGNDIWLLNHMLHNQTPVAEAVYITYEIDFVPEDSPTGQLMKTAQPLWMDVENGSFYPVFDVKRGQGGPDGEYTYPPQPTGKSTKTVGSDQNLIWTAGHVHPGGLNTDLKVTRGGQTVPLFRSDATYWDPAGPVSWDMAMSATPPDYRVGLKQGDVLSVSATYETELASWYESMGIMFGWVSEEGPRGPDPFVSPPNLHGEVTHGHLPENDNHGGAPTGLPDPRTLPDGQTFDNRVAIAGFNYLPGNLGTVGPLGNPPAVAQGGTLTFDNFDTSPQIFHTVTSCKAPCTASTGISFPLADGPADFDSGELGYGPPGITAAANRYEWKTPPSLDKGTYTYFCRVHPYMRGAFRVK